METDMDDVAIELVPDDVDALEKAIEQERLVWLI